MHPGIRAFVFGASISAAAAAGCQTPDPSARPQPLSAFSASAVVKTAVGPAAGNPVLPAAAVVPAGDGPTGVVQAAVLPTGAPAAASPLAIADMEQLALAHNPTLPSRRS